MKIYCLSVGILPTNCYILESDRKNALVIDPGGEPDRILGHCAERALQIKSVLLTHGHFDHIGGVTRIVSETGASLAVHESDEELLYDTEVIGQLGLLRQMGYIPRRADRRFTEGDVFQLDDISLTVMHTPGHTKGSSLLIGEDVIFTGDTVFQGTVGRTDLYGGSEEVLFGSLKRISSLTGEYTLFPGHGDPTTLAQEKTSNPYMGKLL